MRAGILIWSWLGLGRKGGADMQGAVGSSLGPYPSDLAGDWHLWGDTAEQSSQPRSSRSLQVWGMFFPPLKRFCQWHTKVFENPPRLIETTGWKSTNNLMRRTKKRKHGRNLCVLLSHGGWFSFSNHTTWPAASCKLCISTSKTMNKQTRILTILWAFAVVLPCGCECACCSGNLQPFPQWRGRDTVRLYQAPILKVTGMCLHSSPALVPFLLPLPSSSRHRTYN